MNKRLNNRTIVLQTWYVLICFHLHRNENNEFILNQIRWNLFPNEKEKGFNESDV